MGLDQYAHLRNRKVNWRKYYEDDKDEQKGVFVWRKQGVTIRVGKKAA